MGLFMGPIMLALVGAVCLLSRPESQLAGAMTGLILGVGSSLTITRLMRRVDPNNP